MNTVLKQLSVPPFKKHINNKRLWQRRWVSYCNDTYNKLHHVKMPHKNLAIK